MLKQKQHKLSDGMEESVGERLSEERQVKGVGKSVNTCEVWHVRVARVSNGTICRKKRGALYIPLYLGNRRRLDRWRRPNRHRLVTRPAGCQVTRPP